MTKIMVPSNPATSSVSILGDTLQALAESRWHANAAAVEASWTIDVRALPVATEIVQQAARSGVRLLIRRDETHILAGTTADDASSLGTCVDQTLPSDVIHDATGWLAGPADIARYEAQTAEALREAWRERGVSIAAAGAPAVIGPQVSLAAGAYVGPGAVIVGHSEIGAGAHISAGCHLRDTRIGAGAVLKPYTVCERAVVGPACQVGPFAHLREGTTLGEGCRIGNYVETKKAQFADGAKASHLSYVGDAQVGARANIGAGAITCNYDGSRKHKTVIGEDTFVGTNTALVAPVTLGDRVLIAAGSTITTDVPSEALAFGRARQRVIPERGWSILEANRRAKLAAREGKP